MNQGSKRTINSFITMLLMVVSIVVLFRPWITLDDKEQREDMSDAMEEIAEELEDIDDSTLDLIDFALERADISMSTKQMVQIMEKVVGILEDASFSPPEMIVMGSAWNASGMGDMIDDLEDSDLFGWGYGDDVIELLGSFGDAATMVMIMGFVAIVHALITLGALVHQLINPKAKSIFFIVSGIMITVWNCITVSVINDAFKIFAEDVLEVDKMATGTFSAFLPAILSVLVLVNQFVIKPFELGSGMKMAAGAGMQYGAQQSYSPYVQPQMAKAPASGQSFCPSCGGSVSAEAVFCPNCGQSISKPQPAEKRCVGCQTVLEADAVFCPNCGAKNE